jgi:hypothetical protein
MKKTMFRILAVALIVAFIIPAAGCGAINAAKNAITKAQKQVTRPAKSKQAGNLPKRPQMLQRGGRQGQQGRQGPQNLQGKPGQAQATVEQRIARLEKVKAAIEKDGKTAEPIYKKVCDRLERLKAGPPKNKG